MAEDRRQSEGYKGLVRKRTAQRGQVTMILNDADSVVNSRTTQAPDIAKLERLVQRLESKITLLTDINEEMLVMMKDDSVYMQVSNEAEEAISNATDQNYDSAVELLQNRFGQTHRLSKAYLQALTELNPPTTEVSSLRRFYDSSETYIRHLGSIGISTESYGVMLVPAMLDKLPYDVKMSMAIMYNKPDSDWCLSELREALLVQIQLKESCMSPETNAPIQSLHLNINSKQSVNSKPVRNVTRNCVYCCKSHLPSDCFYVTDVRKRKDIVQKAGLCFNCLGKHRVSNCRSEVLCKFCKKRHHSSLYFAVSRMWPGTGNQADMSFSEPGRVKQRRLIVSNSATQTNSVVEGGTCQSNQNISLIEFETTAVTTNAKLLDTVMLKTAVTEVSGTDKTIIANLLFDDGAQRTFITSQLAKDLGLPITRKETVSISVFGSDKRSVHHLDLVTLNVRCNDSCVVVKALVVPEITQPISVNTAFRDIPEFKSLQFADTVNSDKINVQVLIGSDFYYDFVTGHIVKSSVGPVAISSKLGYLVCGPVGIFADRPVAVMSVLTSAGKTPESVGDFWSLENIGIMPNSSFDNDKEFVTYYCTDYIEKHDNTYYAKLPWRENHPVLPSNFDVIVNRTHSTIDRLRKSPEMLGKYSDIIVDQISKNFIEKVSESELDNSNVKHYLAHHPVFKQSVTTPVRIVFDCSFSVGDNPSLNDCLNSGPSLFNEIIQILMRFRFGKIGLAADIEKAFLQIGLHPRDRDVTRFFWPKDPTDPNSPLENNLNSVTNDLIHNIYMDNVVSSVDYEEQALEYYSRSRDVLAEGHFNLRSWSSNCSLLREHARSDGVLEKSLTVDILGVTWDTESDCLSLKSRSINTLEPGTPITKRTVTRDMSKIYDPLGFFTPVTVKIKVFVQSLWKDSYDWDDPLPDVLCSRWREIAGDLSNLPEISLPRCYFAGRDQNAQLELHTFADASKSAYGAVSYLKCGDECILISSKSRVAPNKETTIPRSDENPADLLTRGVDCSKLLCYDCLHWCFDSSTTAEPELPRGFTVELQRKKCIPQNIGG
ncbi:uncharacterized protein LOC141910041 [Tubulanus polymorphus]|uniref:uncharacterized protein LOC141910041 n=1 Tax=Tubulanus polymorphus TaxID=672921 RepID=UPI003DA3F5DA